MLHDDSPFEKPEDLQSQDQIEIPQEQFQDLNLKVLAPLFKLFLKDKEPAHPLFLHHLRKLSKIAATLISPIIGDAAGARFEFLPINYPPSPDPDLPDLVMLPGGILTKNMKNGRQAGQWTDDGSQMLCLMMAHLYAAKIKEDIEKQPKRNGEPLTPEEFDNLFTNIFAYLFYRWFKRGLNTGFTAEQWKDCSPINPDQSRDHALFQTQSFVKVGDHDRTVGSHSIGCGRISLNTIRYLEENLPNVPPDFDNDWWITNNTMEGLADNFKLKLGAGKRDGNGPLMRGGPSAGFANSPGQAMHYADIQSRTTTNGEEVAACAQLQAYLSYQAIHGFDDKNNPYEIDSLSPQELKEKLFSPENLNNFLIEYQDRNGKKAPDRITALCFSIPNPNEEETDEEETEKHHTKWLNWRTKPDEKYILGSLDDFPDRGYYGSYATCGLALVFNAIWTTDSYEDALKKLAYARGDSDSTAAMAASILGPIYGYENIPEENLIAPVSQYPLNVGGEFEATSSLAAINSHPLAAIKFVLDNAGPHQFGSGSYRAEEEPIITDMLQTVMPKNQNVTEVKIVDFVGHAVNRAAPESCAVVASYIPEMTVVDAPSSDLKIPIVGKGVGTGKEAEFISLLRLQELLQEANKDPHLQIKVISSKGKKGKGKKGSGDEPIRLGIYHKNPLSVQKTRYIREGNDIKRYTEITMQKSQVLKARENPSSALFELVFSKDGESFRIGLDHFLKAEEIKEFSADAALIEEIKEFGKDAAPSHTYTSDEEASESDSGSFFSSTSTSSSESEPENVYAPITYHRKESSSDSSDTRDSAYKSFEEDVSKEEVVQPIPDEFKGQKHKEVEVQEQTTKSKSDETTVQTESQLLKDYRKQFLIAINNVNKYMYNLRNEGDEANYDYRRKSWMGILKDITRTIQQPNLDIATLNMLRNSINARAREFKGRDQRGILGLVFKQNESYSRYFKALKRISTVLDCIINVENSKTAKLQEDYQAAKLSNEKHKKDYENAVKRNEHIAKRKEELGGKDPSPENRQPIDLIEPVDLTLFEYKPIDLRQFESKPLDLTQLSPVGDQITDYIDLYEQMHCVEEANKMYRSSLNSFFNVPSDEENKEPHPVISREVELYNRRRDLLPPTARVNFHKHYKSKKEQLEGKERLRQEINLEKQQQEKGPLNRDDERIFQPGEVIITRKNNK